MPVKATVLITASFQNYSAAIHTQMITLISLKHFVQTAGIAHLLSFMSLELNQYCFISF